MIAVHVADSFPFAIIFASYLTVFVTRIRIHIYSEYTHTYIRDWCEAVMVIATTWIHFSFFCRFRSSFSLHHREFFPVFWERVHTVLCTQTVGGRLVMLFCTTCMLHFVTDILGFRPRQNRNLKKLKVTFLRSIWM